MEAQSTAMKAGPATPLSHIDVKLSTACKYGIWTGSADPKIMGAVNATSITGGLRFWTAALIRANGGQTCTDNSKCLVQKHDLGKCCDLCRIFGCTGLSRAFNLSVDDNHGKNTYTKADPAKRVTLEKFTNARGKHPSYYPAYGYTGKIALHLGMRRPLVINGQVGERLGQGLPQEALTALYLMVKYGTLGAYDQYGCGLMSFDSESGEQALKGEILRAVPAGHRERTEAPGLDDFFFAKGKLGGASPKQIDQSIFEIRFLVREAIRGIKGGGTDLRHWFCGAIRGDEICGTNFCLTVDDSGTLRGWGHFSRHHPKYARFREAVLGAVKGVLARPEYCGANLCWRECDSDRDSKGRLPWPKFYDRLISDSEWRKL